jgi:hypothetical protein
MSRLLGLPLPLLALSLVFSIALCVHVVRSHQQMYWLWIILAFQPIGGLVYLLAVLAPELAGGRTARNVGKAARDALDPGRAFRAAKAAYDDAPTVQNSMKLAEACSALGRWSEAEDLYRTACQGLYADDPALLLGRARALVELNRAAEALETLQPLLVDGVRASPQALLLQARAAHALGRRGEAERAYAAAAQRLPGLEGLARQVAFLAEIGRGEEARAGLADLDKRVAKARAHFRKEAKAWRAFAAERVNAAGAARAA